MKFLVFSDTHGHPDIIDKVCYLNKDAHGVIFLGDGIRDLEQVSDAIAGKTLVCVKGNCDSYLDPTPTFASFEVQGVRVAVMHGHEQKVKLTDRLLTELAASGYDVILHGHTHVPREDTIRTGERISGVFNPGCGAHGRFGILSIQNGQYLFSKGVM